MNLRNCLIIAVIFTIISCTLPAIEVTRSFDNCENFNFQTSQVEIEFVKDSSEFVKFIGNADHDPVSLFKIEEKWYYGLTSSYEYLEISGGSYLNNVILDKIEIHYRHVRRFGHMYYQPPISLGVFYETSIYTREPIQEDSIDIIIKNQQDSIIHVNTNYLNITGWAVTRIKMGGNTHHLTATINANANAQQPPIIDLGNLTTDTNYINIFSQYSYIPYARVDVHANNYLDIQTSSLIGSPSECPACICEIYYKGHPTILNRDSLDSRVILIDNN